MPQIILKQELTKFQTFDKEMLGEDEKQISISIVPIVNSYSRFYYWARSFQLALGVRIICLSVEHWVPNYMFSTRFAGGDYDVEMAA